MPRSSISRRALPIALLLVATSAWGGIFSRKKAEPVPEPVEEPKRPPAVETLDALFPDAPPFGIGALPKGLANLSAQGCNGCHYQAHADWERSAHAGAWASEALVQAVEAAGTPACTACHLPLQPQHPDLVAYDAGNILAPIRRPNATYDPTLHTEGVTCAACHVRDGKVVTASPAPDAPHPTVVSDELVRSEACAACHQLTWPGADLPFYDSYGEWTRSPQAAAGIQCQDCHMGPGASGRQLGADHAFSADAARAVSLLVEVDRARVVRGGPPLAVRLRLQNTGAGHAFPTGSPYKGVRLQAALVGPGGEQGEEATWGAPFVTDLVRTLEAAAPWATVTDSRLPPGGERHWTWEADLGQDAPSGRWFLQVTLERTVLGEVRGEPFVRQRIPLEVE